MESRGYDPLEIGEVVRRFIVKRVGGRELRKYYRFRGGRWYGGIATADCVGCNLSCRFCWNWRVNTRLRSVGRFYTGEEVARRIISIARRRGYRQARISGGEPTLSMDNLIEVLETLNREEPRLLFILETNGIVLGARKEEACRLACFPNVHVRVSIKGTSPEEFHILTGAKPEAFELQLKALENLLDCGVSAHPSVMLSFSTHEGFERLLDRLREIDPVLAAEVEEEYVFLYPHVVELLKRYGLKPRIAFSPDNIPEELI